MFLSTVGDASGGRRKCRSFDSVPKINAVVMNESKSGLNGDNHKGVVGSGSCLLLLVE